MNLRNLRIGARLGIGFAIILALLMLVVFAANFISKNNADQLKKGLEIANAKIVLANTMKSAILEGAIAMRNVGLRADGKEMQREQARVQEQRKVYAVPHDKLVALGLNDDEKKILSNLQSLDKKMEAPFAQAMELALGFLNAESAKILSATIDPLTQQSLTEITSLVNIQQVASTEAIAGMEVAAKKLQIMLYLIGVIALAIASVCAWILTTSITRPLRNAVAVAQKVSTGDLTSQ